jgi:peptidoglycan hydrolase-like protein with peptidoglycan-binding domain
MPYTLTSPRFSGNARLRKAANNAPPLKKGARGEAVRIIQQALIDHGIALPTSTQKHGTPDGIFGAETKTALINFQQDQGLTFDGDVGTNTMRTLDALFPEWAPAPPPVIPASYEVPGLRHLLQQPNDRTCWAVAYTMMRSWQDNVPHAVETAVGYVGSEYVQVWNLRAGLPFFEIKPFYQKGGLRFEDLQSLTIEGWIEMLKTHGMLMVSISFSSTDNQNHANLVWGVFGDGTVDGTKIAYIDPYYGLNFYEDFASFHKRLLGIAIVEDGLDNESIDAYVQVAHF